MDIFNENKRSEIMSKIKSFGTKSTEVIFRQLLNNVNLKEWETNYKDLPCKRILFLKNKKLLSSLTDASGMVALIVTMVIYLNRILHTGSKKFKRIRYAIIV